MELYKILTEDVITDDLKGDSKAEIIDSLIELLASAGRISDRNRIRECILAREAQMSTGMENGVAIPHGKSDAVDELVACVGIKKGGVDFKSLDGKPSRIFIMTISPPDRLGQHVQFLAEISRLLRDSGDRQRLVDAESVNSIQSIICG